MDFFESNIPPPSKTLLLLKKLEKLKKLSKNIFSVATPQILIDFPLKLPFLKIFEIVVESSLIAHLIKNFTLKNIQTSHFSIKLTCEELLCHTGTHIYSHKKGS